MGAPRGTVPERFERFVDRTADCWLWTGARTPLGYGMFTVSVDSRVFAHRLAYELFVGPIPDGLVIDHLCENPSCVNPAHLEPVTQGVNVIRSPVSASGRNIRKTVCPKGHPYDRVNVDGSRRCSICTRASEQRRNARRKAARHAKHNALLAPLRESASKASTQGGYTDGGSSDGR